MKQNEKIPYRTFFAMFVLQELRISLDHYISYQSTQIFSKYNLNVIPDFMVYPFYNKIGVLLVKANSSCSVGSLYRSVSII